MPAMIDSRRLLAFYTLTQTGSFTQTASELDLTQSAISHSIAGLEKNLGVRLFERIGRRVEITEAGAVLLDYVKVIMETMEKAQESMAALAKKKSTREE